MKQTDMKTADSLKVITTNKENQDPLHVMS